MTDQLRTQRLRSADVNLASRLFALMTEVFEEPSAPLGAAYMASLLARDDFWALAAFAGEDLVGGLTAHTLPMTREEGREVFLYDLAVLHTHQRRGVGRALVTRLCQDARAQGIAVVFVPADNDDLGALDFYRALGGQSSPVTIFTFDGS
jgi:aminoglycoside 3-N-acetyltransferase I